MRRIAILDAPSNLGLRPPTATSVPGCAKAPGALRDHGLLTRLHARDAGCLTPPRYDPGDWRPGDGVSQAAEIAGYSRRLADRIGAIIDAGEFPVVLGGDCSIVLGSGLAMNRLGEDIGGRIGLVFVDGHSDFRHPGNASYVGAAAGEDLALVTGRGQPDLAAMEGRRPYFRDIDVVVLGLRAQDEYRLDLQAAGIITRPVPALRAEGAARSAQWARDQLVDCAGYWVHLDVDVLDPAVMPAVDAPSPGGIAFPELEILLAGLVDTPHCLGVEITVYDPDYDPDGAYAEEITAALVSGLAPVRTLATRPDLIAARRDLATRPDDRTAAAYDDDPPALALASPYNDAPPAPAPTYGDEPATAYGDDPPALASAYGDEPATAYDDASAASGEPVEADEPAAFEAPTGHEGDDGDEGDAVDQDGEAGRGDDEPGDGRDPVERRRAAAAADSVALAAAGMSGAPDAPAVPAVTLLGIGDDAQPEDEPVHNRPLVPRPLGPSPRLDSEPLPATRPGLLRPRPSEDDSFTLPAQRPAFDIGPEKPADIS